MTITESVHSILASDAEPIRMYKWSGSAPARGIIQIAHGMGEHALRYRPIAHALVSAGYTVYANDHRGHGEFAAQANVLGDFGPGGFPVLVDDMARVTQAVGQSRPEAGICREMIRLSCDNLAPAQRGQPPPRGCG